MAANIDRFKSDLSRLIKTGEDLALSMLISTMNWDDVEEMYKKQGKSEKDIEIVKDLLFNFPADYQLWYSESLALIKQLIPDRLEDFRAQYERPRGRKDDNITFVSYVISDYMLGLRTSRMGETVADQKAALPKFKIQRGILGSARNRFESSLYEIKQLVQADLFDSEIDTARELLKKKFLRAAGAVAGVVLEKHLRQVCNDHGVTINKKNPGIADLNDSLKNFGVIDIPQWRHITLMGDYRNLCDHNKLKEPSADEVSDLIAGTDRILKTIS